MIVPSLASVRRNAPGMSTWATSLLSFASIADPIKIDSVNTVGDDVSRFDL